ncbi:MAG: GNAT family N-acetyltransferase [Candidatus Heimdallarchaeota archaeon]|nr:GNAT family N-acetyltransferase [Candidatus Heimdallarchaeota archaeon]
MFLELPKENYLDVKHLFKDKSYLNIFRSHLERTPIEKKVFVDNLENPQTAIIYGFPRLFFGGKADNEKFNSEFRRFLYEDLIKEYLNKNQHEVDCYFANDEWLEGVKNVLKEPFFYDRYYYEIKKIKLENWRDLIPENYSLEPVDLSLLEKKHLVNYDWLIEEIEENWVPFEEYLNEIRGFYLLRNNEEIVSWCTLEYLTEDNEIEVGIATKSEFQNKGFASIVGSAAAEYSLTKYKSVGWNCSVGNVGSCKTAEKIGFEIHTPYIKAGCFFNKIDNWIVHGFTQASMKRYEKAIDYYELVLKAIEDKDPEFEEVVVIRDEFPLNVFIFRLATYYAANTDITNSFKTLRKALEHGFKNKKMLEEDELLSSLHDKGEWKEILDTIS